MTQLASKLIARDINYRHEFEAIIETFGAVFPKSCLENFFETHSISLPNNRQLMILTLYQAGDNGDRVRRPAALVWERRIVGWLRRGQLDEWGVAAAVAGSAL